MNCGASVLFRCVPHRPHRHACRQDDRLLQSEPRHAVRPRQAVADGVNVDFDVYRIRTRVTEQGATIVADPTGVYVDKRQKLTRAERIEKLKQDLTYTANELDRDVVNESQIRPSSAKIPRTRCCLTHSPDAPKSQNTDLCQGRFPCRRHRSHGSRGVRVQETSSAGKHLPHRLHKDGGKSSPTSTADVVKADKGEPVKKSIWVRTSTLTPDEILSNFRNSYFPRIAVTVDMISTGTDVKPIECVFFLRNVKSAGFFEQMKGRGVRVISPDKLRVVTPSARPRIASSSWMPSASASRTRRRPRRSIASPPRHSRSCSNTWPRAAPIPMRWKRWLDGSPACNANSPPDSSPSFANSQAENPLRIFPTTF